MHARPTKPDLAAVAGLLAISLVPFAPLLWSAPFTAKSDVVDLVLPHAAMLVRSVREGVFPLWNPTLGAGLPYLATIPLTLPFYPTVALYFVFDLAQATSLTFLVHFLVGPVLFYAAGRAMGLRPLAAFVGGAAAALCNMNLAYIREGYLQEAAAMAYVGVPFAVFEAAARRPDRWLRAGGVGAIGLGLMLAGGCPIEGQMIAYTFSVYVAIRLVTLRSRAVCTRSVGAGLLAYGAGLALAAVHWLPMMEAMAFAYRAPSQVEWNGYVRPWQLLGWLLPYAERMALRLQRMGQPNYRNGFQVTLQPGMLERPLSWRRPRQVFVNSMSDLFHEEVPEAFIREVFEVMTRASRHTFQVLTKRSRRLRRLSQRLPWPRNVWMGVSVESDAELARVADLRDVPASVRFLSLEPLLGPLASLDLRGMDWVIVGGESGPRARPMEPSWVVSLRDRALAAQVPFFFKQWGGVQKARTGRLLEGRTWDEMPSPEVRWVPKGLAGEGWLPIPGTTLG